MLLSNGLRPLHHSCAPPRFGSRLPYAARGRRAFTFKNLPSSQTRIARRAGPAHDNALRRLPPWKWLQTHCCSQLLSIAVAWSACAALSRLYSYRAVAALASRLILVIIAFAFNSLARQADGLMGPGGISPPMPEASEDSEDSGVSWRDWVMLGRLRRSCPGRVSKWCAGAAACGALLPPNAFGGLIAAAVLVWLSAMYRCFMSSLFLQFQWDILLIECGLLGAFAALAAVPRSLVVQQACAALATQNLVLLGFKLMWGSCVCKLASRCPEWNFGTAMQHHHMTTCIPKAFARRMHLWSNRKHVHSSIQGLATLCLEGPVSLLAISGFAPARLACMLAWCGLMMSIAATGNYGFFNLLGCVLAFALFDDGQLGVVGRLLTPPAGPQWLADSPAWVLTDGLPWAVVLVSWVLYAVATVGVLHEISGSPPPSWCTVAQRSLAPLGLGARYGLFARMTTTRDEVVIRELHELPPRIAESAGCLAQLDSQNKFWVELALPYKPGPLNRSPPAFFTHMPRVDWQMWFVSLAWARSGETPPWFKQFLRLLSERQPAVVGLVAHKSQAEVQTYVLARRPLATKVTFENYRYSEPRCRSGQGRKPEWECGDWWCRRRRPSPEGPLQTLRRLWDGGYQS